MSDGETPETSCPNGEDNQHCEHWYDDAAPCCSCCDDSGKAHGDHWPSLDCKVCAERIDDGHLTLARTYELAEVRYERTGRAFLEPSTDCEDICMDECQGPCGVFS